MSIQSAAKPSTTARVASRRTVVRGAAWTGAAVTIVVATPNIAAASTRPPGTASGTLTRNDGKNVTFAGTFTNTSGSAYTLIVVTTFKNGSTTTTVGPVAPGGSVPLPPNLLLQSNDNDQTVTLTFYADSIAPLRLVGTLTFVDVDRLSTRPGSWTV